MKRSRFPWLQILVHAGGWLPLAFLVYAFLTNNLTVNPIQALEQRTGLYALDFLLLSLACTPLSYLTGWKEPQRRRKALGNYAFLYASLHVFTFFVIDYGLDLGAVWRDVRSKWYILIGATAFLLLLPLALTSINFLMKRLGKNWKRLHRLIYFIAPLVVVHFLMVVKGSLFQLRGNLSQPLLYGSLVLLLLSLRLPFLRRRLVALRIRLTDRWTARHGKIRDTRNHPLTGSTKLP